MRASGPITITISEGMVVVAEKTYADARKAEVAFRRRPPRWFSRAVNAMAAGRRLPALSGAEEGQRDG